MTSTAVAVSASSDVHTSAPHPDVMNDRCDEPTCKRNVNHTMNGPCLDNNRYLVSRNGVILSWEQIHQRYGDINNAKINTNSHSITTDLQPLSSTNLLQLLPRGAYTTCRTVKGGQYIYQFDYHVKRLAKSSASILESVCGIGCDDGIIGIDRSSSKVMESSVVAPTSTTTSVEEHDKALSTSNHPKQHYRTPSMIEMNHLKITNEAWERSMALDCIRLTLDAFRARYLEDTEGNAKVQRVGVDSKNVEFRITLLATWEKKNNNNSSSSNATANQTDFESVLYCHVGLLPWSANQTLTSTGDNKKHITVLIHGHGRENAAAKDSKWVIDRQQLTEAPHNEAYSNANTTKTVTTAPTRYEEIILINNEGQLLEGTQTNFYVVKDSSTIITADEGVLAGSVRDSVLRVCKSHGIDVELRPPTLEDLKVASGVFITSTSRLVMPVHEVVLGDLLLMEKEAEGVTTAADGDAAALSSYCYLNCPTTESIRQWVLEDVETHSIPIN
eukprot:g3992.t1 g3992   contig15:92682-94184(-)